MKRGSKFVWVFVVMLAAAIATALPASAVNVSPTSLAFGDQTVGTTSAPQTFTITPTVIQGVSGIATTDAEFAFTAPPLTSCTNSFPCTVTVTFTPASTGTKSASILLVLSGFQSGQTQAIPVTGNGVAAPPPALAESAWAIGLPIAGVLLLFGVGLWLARRRRVRAAA